MVALSGCIWLQAFVIALETKWVASFSWRLFMHTYQKCPDNKHVKRYLCWFTVLSILRHFIFLNHTCWGCRIDCFLFQCAKQNIVELVSDNRFRCIACITPIILSDTLISMSAWLSFGVYSSFTILQHLAIWGNLVGFYVINWIVSAIPATSMYTIMFRLCKQPSYWITMLVSLRFLTFVL